MPLLHIELSYHSHDNWDCLLYLWESPFWTFPPFYVCTRGTSLLDLPHFLYHSHASLLSDLSPWFSPYGLFIAQWIYDIFIDVVTPL
jgi:hypothetical protein